MCPRRWNDGYVDDNRRAAPMATEDQSMNRRVRLTVGSLRREASNPEPLSRLLRMPQIVLGLLIEPTLCGCSKRDGKAYRHFGTDTRTPIQDRRKRFPAYIERFGCRSNRKAKRLEAERSQNLARMRWIVHTHIQPSYARKLCMT